MVRDDDRFVLVDVWPLRGDDAGEFFTGKMAAGPINAAMNADPPLERENIYFRGAREVDRWREDMLPTEKGVD